MVTGLQKAEALIKQPIKSNKQSNDVVLSGITDMLEEAAYKLQVLHMRIGHMWELVFTDCGFTKKPRESTLLIIDAK